METSENSPKHTLRPWQECLAGIGLGLAVGILVGMSTSPVVAVVVSSLAAVLAAFFGLSAGSDEGARVLRIASFGFVCPLAVLLGLDIRTHSWFAPSINEQIREWTDAGYPANQARQFVAFRQLGLVAGPADGLKAVKATDLPKPINGLFGAPGDTNDPVLAECGRLASSRFSSTDEQVSAMKNAGAAWKALGDSVAELDAARRKAVVDAAYQLVCRQ
jgi:hypothetical protein